AGGLSTLPGKCVSPGSSLNINDASSTQSSLSEHRKPRKDHLRVHARIECSRVAVRDVVVLIADREAASGAVHDLHAAAEVEGEVELGGVRLGDLFVEIEEAAGGLAEGLNAAVA